VTDVAGIVGLGPTSVAVGDFNGDGKLDLAVTAGDSLYSAVSSSVWLLLGKGDGTFQAGTNYSLGYFPGAVVTGDFNGDGKLDLAVATGLYSPFTSDNISVLLGNGDGTFQSAVNLL